MHHALPLRRFFSRPVPSSISQGTSTVVRMRNGATQNTIVRRKIVMQENHYTCIVIGAGLAGLAVANNIANLNETPCERILILEPTCFVEMDTGLNVMPYGITDQEETQIPVLKLINSMTQVQFEEVVHLDPANKFVATYEGSELSYDYLVNCSGSRVDLSFCEGLAEALNDEYSFVVGTFSFEASLKMEKRLQMAVGKDYLVYHAGPEGQEWSHAINHALLLASRGKDVRMLVNGERLHQIQEVHDRLENLLEEKGVHINYNTVPKKVLGDTSIQLLNQKDGSTEDAEFSLFFFQPHRTLPKFMANSEHVVPQVDPLNFQSPEYRSYFSVGDSISRNNSMTGLMEDCHGAVANLSLQQWCDNNTNNLYNHVIPRSDYNRTPIFTSEKHLFFIETELGKYLNPLDQPSRLSFYNYLLREYKYYFKYSKDSKWLGRRGFRKLNFKQLMESNYLREMSRTPHHERPYALEII